MLKEIIIGIAAFVITATLVAAMQYSADSYQFNYGELSSGNNSIQILANIEKLTLSTDYGSVGNSGKIGYIVYNADNTIAYQSEALFYKQLQPSNDIVISNLLAGQHVGFFLERNNGKLEENFVLYEHDGNVFMQFAKNGKLSGNSEAFMISSVQAAPQGQPLPGTLITLLIGSGIFTGAVCFGKRRRVMKH